MISSEKEKRKAGVTTAEVETIDVGTQSGFAVQDKVKPAIHNRRFRE